MYNVAWYLIRHTIISVAVVIVVEYGLCTNEKSHFVHFRQMCIFFITTCHWADNTSWGKVWLFLLFFFFFFPVLWLSKNNWTVKIKVTSYIFLKMIIPKSFCFCYGVFLLPTKKLRKFSKRVIQIVTLILDYCFTVSLIQWLLIGLMFVLLSHHTTCLCDTFWKSK